MAGRSDSCDVHATLCSSAMWSDKPLLLRRVASHLPLPAVAQIVDGRYRSIAAADSKHHHHHHHHASSRHSSSVVYIQSVRTSQKVLMETVKLQPNGRHVVSTGHNCSMTLSYGGWFEVLSEDGKAIQPISTVAELTALWPPECVVREPVRVIVCSGAKHDNPDHLRTTRLDQTRTVMAGEWLALRDVVEATLETASHVDETTSAPGGDSTQTKQYLRCVDAVGDSIFLAMNQRALVSPVAGPYNISGVHSVQSLLDKFRLPLIVRLVCGVIPTKLQKSFTSVFRLIGVYEDETAFILPLQTASPTEARMLSVSTREPIVFVGAANIDVLRQSLAFATVERRCSELVRAYMNSIHVLVAPPDVDAVARGNQILRDSQNLRYDEPPSGPESRDDDDEIALTYDEIDDIYRYVRQGGEPPSPRTPPTAVETAADTGRQQPVRPDEHTAADYNWEEPIYEDIEKIRQRKRQRATMTDTTTDMATIGTSTTTTTTTVDDQDKSSNVDVIPVGNLRQLIKRFSMLESSASSKPKTKPKPVRLQDRAPPVPPKLTVDVDVGSQPPAPETDVEHQQHVDVVTSQPAAVNDSVSLDVVDNVRQDSPAQSSAEHVVDTSPAAACHGGAASACYGGADDCQSSVGGVTSVRVSRDVTRRRQPLTDAAPYYCSRVAVHGGAVSSSVQPIIVDTHSTITRISTLSRQSARRPDFNQPTT